MEQPVVLYCDSCKKCQLIVIVKHKRSKYIRAYCKECYNWIRSDNAADKEELRKKVHK